MPGGAAGSTTVLHRQEAEVPPSPCIKQHQGQRLHGNVTVPLNYESWKELERKLLSSDTITTTKNNSALPNSTFLELT